MTHRSGEVPNYDDLDTVSRGPAGTAWGLFDNDLGTLNFQNPEAVVRAAGLVSRGVVFSLNLETTQPDPPILGRGLLETHRVPLEGGGFDDYYDSFYPQASSQWDALSHVEHPTHGFFHGHTIAEVTDPHRPALGIESWAKRGIVGRFVLADVSAFIDPSSSDAVPIELLDAVLAEQGSVLEPGDVLLVNTGWIAWYRGLGAAQRRQLAESDLFPAPGLDPSENTARWLWDHRISAVAADCPALERMPFDKASDDGFLHLRLIPKLGYAIGELFDLEALAADCATDGRYHGFFCSAPLNTPGGAGSPANALAMK